MNNPKEAFNYIYLFASKPKYKVASPYDDNHYYVMNTFKRGSLLCQQLSTGGNSVAFNGNIAVTDETGHIAYLGGMTSERLCKTAEQIRKQLAKKG